MSEDHHQLLGGISPTEFLQKYWQKKPCLIRQAIPGFSSFISRQELLQLAADDTVESRIVLEKDGEYPWQVMHGPLDASIVSMLPASHWTLLVQGVNYHDPQAAELLQQFSFIPAWRIDDLMISYAPDQGSVGPHLDSYDVFLLQALGRRHWRISTQDYTEADFSAEADLRIIEHFTPEVEWELEPGDMLYLPPGVAHHGIARGECMTYSIGLRAPTRHELLSQYLEDKYDPAGDIQYSDPDLEVPQHRGEIQIHNLDRIREMMRSALADPDDIDNWFGCYITAPPEQLGLVNPPAPVDEAGFKKLLSRGGQLQLHYAYRAAFSRFNGEIRLYVNGSAYRIPGSCRDLVTDITGFMPIDCSTLGPDVPLDCIQVLYDLYNKGILISR